MRLLFPTMYLGLLAPAVLLQNAKAAGMTAAFLFLLAVMRQPKVAWAFAKLVLASSLTFVPFLLVVRSAVCSQDAMWTWELARSCVLPGAAVTLSTLALAVAIFAVASANEWRHSMTATVNGLGLPRLVRITALLSVVMVGDFRKAISRAHHAFVARGEASPTFRMRNVYTVPGILANAWGSVLANASQRLEGVWASDTFWDTHVPLKPKPPNDYRRSTLFDLLLVAVVLAVVVASLPTNQLL